MCGSFRTNTESTKAVSTSIDFMGLLRPQFVWLHPWALEARQGALIPIAPRQSQARGDREVGACLLVLLVQLLELRLRLLLLLLALAAWARSPPRRCCCCPHALYGNHPGSSTGSGLCRGIGACHGVGDDSVCGLVDAPVQLLLYHVGQLRQGCQYLGALQHSCSKQASSAVLSSFRQ